jgi:hypothetical protein
VTLLLSVTFREPVSISGFASMGGASEFPPAKGGWSAVEGWSMRVVGDRLEIISPPGAPCPQAHKTELLARGIDEEQAVHVTSVPLAMCVLRYAGLPAGVADANLVGPPSAPPQHMESPPAIEMRLEAQEAKSTRAGALMDAVAGVTPLPVAKLPDPPKPKPKGPPMPTPAPRGRVLPPGARAPSKPTGIVRDLDDSEAEKVLAGRVKRELEVAPAMSGEDGVTEVDL